MVARLSPWGPGDPTRPPERRDDPEAFIPLSRSLAVLQDTAAKFGVNLKPMEGTDGDSR